MLHAGLSTGSGGPRSRHRFDPLSVYRGGDGSSSQATLTDVRIADLSGDDDGVGGDGLIVSGGAQVEGQGVEIHAARQAGIQARSGASLTLSHVWVADTQPQACASSTCPETTAAVGVHANDATVSLSDFGLVDNATAGASSLGGQITLQDGGIARQVIWIWTGTLMEPALVSKWSVRKHQVGVWQRRAS